MWVRGERGVRVGGWVCGVRVRGERGVRGGC